ncbi:MAG: hypothetical protein Kow00124_28630 [Anaerolineae bacterium]
MKSAVTPLLHGDAKLDQNTFLLPPVSVDDLHNTRSSRNFWVVTAGDPPWSATGQSAAQRTHFYNVERADSVTVTAGLLWHTVTREDPRRGLRADITSFVPVGSDLVELMGVTLTNTGDSPLEVTPIAAIPIFGRSADNLRDHRHVTPLLHRIATGRYGVVVTPTLSFDERGHTENRVSYFVLAADAAGAPPRWVSVP